MSPPPQTSSPSQLSSHKAEATRDLIRGATHEMLTDGHASTLSMQAVAERAGLSVRTLYRYFPSKKALLDDVAMVFSRRAEDMMAPKNMSHDPYSYLPILWSELAAEMDVVRSQHRTPMGDELRLQRLGPMRSMVSNILESEVDTDQASQEDLDVLRDLVIAITSSSMFLELVDRHGFDPLPASKHALWVIDAIREKFDADGGIS